MTEQIGVQFVSQDAGFIASTKLAAANVAAVTKQEEKLAAVAKELGVDGKKLSAEYMRVERTRAAEERRNQKQSEAGKRAEAKTAQSTSKAVAAAAKKQSAADERAQKKADADKKRDEKLAATKAKKADADAKKAARVASDFKAKKTAAAATEISEFKAVASAAAGVTVAIAASVLAAGYLVAKVAEAGIKAVELRENARGFLNVLTAGRGDKALENVDRLAKQLGVDFNVARQEYIDFRQAGLDNRQSAKLIKLAADLNTVDHSGELARQAISRVLSYTSPNGIQTPEQIVAADRAMALLAKQAHVSGKGLEAAKESATTLNGALNRLENLKTSTLEKLGERVKPSVDKAATAVSNMVERFVASEKGQRALELTAEAVEGIANAAVRAVPAVERFAVSASAALDNPVVKTALVGLKLAAEGAAIAVGVLAAGALILVAPLIAIGAAVVLAIGAVGRLGPALLSMGADAAKSGVQLVAGLIEGIESGAAKLYAKVEAMAQRIKTTFKSALHIQSPSKDFVGYGKNIGAGAEKGIVASMPTGAEIAKIVRPANDNAIKVPVAAQLVPPSRQTANVGTPVARGGQGGPSGAAGAESGASFYNSTYDISITVEHGTPSGSVDDQVYAAMDRWWARKLQQQGAA